MAPTAPAHPSAAEWQAMGDKLAKAPGQASSAVNGIYDLVNDILSQWWCPGWVADWVRPVLENLWNLAKKIIEKIEEVLVGFAFPIVGFFVANDWNDLVKNPVSKTQGLVSDNNLKVDDEWKGPAAEAYHGAVKAQTDAMGEVDDIVGDLQVRLWVVCGAMAAFYAAVAVVVFQWIAVMIAASAADATGIGAILGIPVQVGDTAVSASSIGALVAALVALLAAEAESFTTLNGRVANSSKFPGGHWPEAVTGKLKDASLKDGDDTDWHRK